MGKVWFVGAGPGDPELITVKGQKLLERAGAVLYAGSLVSKAALMWAKPECEVMDSKGMTLDEITDWLILKAKNHETVIRLQTGDPSLYGALVEMVQPLDEAQIEVGVVPGVSSALASAAAGVESLTLPEVTQTVILTRVEGKTPMPVGESLQELASHHCTLCIFLSITLLDKIEADLVAAGWSLDSQILVVHKASWPEERVFRVELKDLQSFCSKQGIKSQTMIIASPTIGARYKKNTIKSKLYDESFSHQFRKAK